MTWHCHVVFRAFSLKGEADEVILEEMHQGCQMGQLCFGKSSLFLKKLGGGGSRWLCVRRMIGEKGVRNNTSAQGICFCEDLLTFMYYKHHQVVRRVETVSVASLWSQVHLLHRGQGVVFSICWALLWQWCDLQKLFYTLLRSCEGCTASPRTCSRLSTLRSWLGGSFPLRWRIRQESECSG